MKYNVEIEIKNIDVDWRYYSFEYTAKCKGLFNVKDEYSDDYCNGDTQDEFKKYLKNGGALSILLERIYYN